MFCPDDQVCAHVTAPDEELCADPAQLAACEGRATYAHCGANGRCYDGVCLPVSCGNGRIDRADPSEPADEGEVCDDHNERSGDGCSSDCRSNEACGNGVIDPIDLERCDDGDRISNDGCDSVCQPERARWHALFTQPFARNGQGLSYDLVRDRAVMFGGHFDLDTDETWEITTTGFAPMHPPQAPTARGGTAMVYDVAHHQTVLFGGALSKQTWTWDGTTWSEALVLDSPGPRQWHAMAYDIRRERVVLFGGKLGGDFPGDSDETWEWDGAIWKRINTVTVPRGRARHAMVYDPTRGVTVMWGGDTLDQAVWEYDGVDWHAVQPSGTAPVSRMNLAMAYDPVRRRVMVVGGETYDAPLSDAWAWNGATWERMPSPDPPFDAGHIMTTDLRRGRVLLLAYDSLSANATTWWWDGVAWARGPGNSGDAAQSRVALDPLRATLVGVGMHGLAEFDGTSITTTTHDPSGHVRLASAIAYDPIRRQTVLFGGTLDNEAANDTWTWDGSAWRATHPVTSPSPRVDAGMAFDAKTGRVLLFGGAMCGHSDCDVLDDTWEWDGVNWHLANPAHRPPARTRAAFAYDPIRQVIVMFGGSGPTKLDDTWTWNGTDWTEQVPPSQPSARDGVAMAWDASRERLTLFGGTSDVVYGNDDVWEWDGQTWTRVAVSDSPARTGQAFGQAPGGGLLMFGGSAILGSPSSAIELLRWDGASPSEGCRSDIDSDGDGLAGCADPDCWWACAPLCPPGAPCDPTAPHCGDGVCNTALEDGWICPADCTRPAICGDAMCDLGEHAATCPGDCP